MKKYDLSICLILCIISLFGCTRERSKPIAFFQHDDIPEIEISHDHLHKPLRITGNETGSIFFETMEGKTWLKGKADEVNESGDKLEAVWKMDNREVIVVIEKMENDFHFSFEASPDKDILKWGFYLNATENEYFTGLFERTVDGPQQNSWAEGITTAMDLRGQAVDMIIKPTLSLYNPFYISSNGYGLFIEGTWPGHYDFCKTDSQLVSISFEGPSLTGIIYTADEPAELVQKHALHTGPTIVPPEWAFQPWRWRDNHDHRETYYDGTPVNAPYNSMLVEDILMMEALDIPCGLYWVDRPWAKGFRGYADFEWDPERFPDAQNMIDWVHENDMKFMLWIAPWVVGDMKVEADKNDYVIPLKSAFGEMDSTNSSLIDFTNPDAVAWWQEKGVEKVLKQGIDGFKMDRAEEMVPETRDISYYDGRTAREVRNDYPVLYVKAVHESAQKIKGDDFILLPRAGYTGSMQYSGFWGGDIGSEPEGLRAAIIAVQRSAIIGFPIWGSDIGGYWQGDLDREVLARWLAFGCFNPIMEVGPTEDRAPWDMATEPHYDTALIATWRLYAKVHASLAGYSHDLAKEAHETGMPPVRPLFLAFPEQEQAWKEWQTFMYGPDILVSAIWQKGRSKSQVYLPEGEKWRDAWDTTQVYEGGQVLEISTPMHKIPIFIRDRSAISLGDLHALYEESLAIAEQKPDMKALEEKAFGQDK